jgi:SAM-dependent methyltransferase
MSLGREQLADYWENQGRRAAESEHEAVCYPGAPQFLNAYVDWSQRRAVDRLLRRIGSLAGKSALDVGCGTGRWSRLLASRGADVLAVDRSSAMLDVAAQRTTGVRFARMEATSLDLPSDSVDLALQVTMIQHLPADDQPLAIGEIARVVKPGGYVISLDVVGHADAFSTSHGTFPRARSEWVELWRRAGVDPVATRGQDFGYPLVMLRLKRRTNVGLGDGTRRSASGWRSRFLHALVGVSYATDWAVSFFPGLPASHVAGLYRVR